MIDSDFVQMIVLVAILITAIAVARAKDLIHATIALGAMSLLLAIEFYLLRAPDVAIAEAGVGAALTTVVYLYAIRATEREEDL